ncbi:MAG: formylglycine-generating enzyme family protein [Verrucomicrobia bacterium]|nr:formylglycine-generating enzyme family protein [Verrucomicrobiota bacterium]
MKRKFRTALWIFLLLVGVGGFAAWKNWHDRYVWPGPVASMQDLPPLDRSGWPKQPVAWKSAVVQTGVATPDGMKKVPITYYTNSIGLVLVRIEAGSFLMGLTEQQAVRLHTPNLPGHRVTLTKPYFLGAFEVSNKEYELFDPAHKKKRPKYQRRRGGENHPVEPVTWQEAQKFCRWLSAKEGRVYRLPTEAEWEYACKAGTETRLYWGDAYWDGNKANVAGLKWDHETWIMDGFEYTAPVGTYPPNPWGLYDMIGNSWEWCSDWFSRYKAEPAVDPQGPAKGHCRVYKGGGWSTRQYSIKSAVRDGDDPADLPDIRGFRVLCEAN